MMAQKVLLASAGIVALVLVSSFLGMAMTAPTGPAGDSTSAGRLEAGPHPVKMVDLTFVDESRPTAANGDYAGADSRTFQTTIWFPDANGPRPLVIYSHGFMSFRAGGAYLAEYLASQGYIVASTDYPLTNFFAPGGPMVVDVANQPADVSFLIDSILGLPDSQRPVAATPDINRIGLMGLSLGGLTTTLAAFHGEMRDPRVKAAVSIAGPADFFSARFFETSDIPFLMIAGTEDAMVPYGPNASVIPRRVYNGALISIAGGSHTGFAHFAEPYFRFVDHPDSVGCDALMENLDAEPDEDAFPDFGGERMGVELGDEPPRPCQVDLTSKAIHPGRQHMITLLAVWDFFDSVFNEDAETRSTSRRHLAEELARDFPEVSFERNTAFAAD